MRPSRSRCTTRSPSASIRPRKRSSLSCSSQMRSDRASYSARLRTVVASTEAASLPSARHVNASRSQRRNADAEQGDGNQARRAEQLGQAGGDQDRDDDEEVQLARVGALERRGKRRRRHMPARRRTHVHRPRVRTAGFRLVDLAGLRLHAQCIGTQRLGKISADRSNFSGRRLSAMPRGVSARAPPRHGRESGPRRWPWRRR